MVREALRSAGTGAECDEDAPVPGRGSRGFSRLADTPVGMITCARGVVEQADRRRLMGSRGGGGRIARFGSVGADQTAHGQ